MSVRIAAFYKFFRFPDFAAYKAPLSAELCALGVKGSVLIAPEGVNGTIATSPENLDAALALLSALPGAGTLTPKFSTADAMPFLRLKVRLKREIVTMGVPGTDPESLVGTYVAPKDWNALIADPDVVVIDTRNAYETRIGTFAHAIDPHTEHFSDFPAWFRAFTARLAAEGRTPKIAMFCTGGIRCEKATSFAKAEGIADVFHLQGGILQYLEDVPAAQSLWQGECFVFDERVSVGHDLKPGAHVLCRACGSPVSPEEQALAAFVPGVACPHCTGTYDADRRARFAERQRQIDLARTRGRAHLGPADHED